MVCRLLFFLVYCRVKYIYLQTVSVIFLGYIFVYLEQVIVMAVMY